MSVLLLAACGAGGGYGTAPSADPSTAASSAPSAEPSASAGSSEAYTVKAVDDATLGAYLTDGFGHTLYVFKNDSSDTSTCTGACAGSWPAFILEAGAVVEGGEGVTGAFGTITRADGTKQITYDHQPLYYFAGDSAAGDTNGQGIGNVWFVAPVSGDSGSASPSPP
ncbi:MAG: COG4315 family predicted lipoprotein, partial [Candidatus Limnocylindrales bacterium]